MKCITCPICNGVGEIEKPKKRRSLDWKIKKAGELRNLGFTYHEIKDALGYASPRSAHELVKKYNKLYA